MPKPTLNARNWQAIIQVLLDFSELEKSPNNRFFNVAQQLQNLIELNATEAEKEAVFEPIVPVYIVFENNPEEFKDAIHREAEKSRQARIQSEQQKAELNRWQSLPFYAKDRFTTFNCVERENTLENKFFALSCILDNLKAVPYLLELSTTEANFDELGQRLTEMTKLYILFAHEQLELLQKATFAQEVTQNV